jgi:hypothetical protein
VETTRSEERDMSGTRGFVRWVVVAGVVLFGVGGVWAFGWPHGFFAVIATYPPYNRHLFHDLGAFQIAIAAALAGGLVWRDAVTVGLLGGTVGMVVHAASHVIDHGLGGTPYDMWLLLALAAVFVAALWVRLRQVRSLRA